MARLIVIRGVDEGREFTLEGARLGIGRDRTSGVHLHDTEVSRRHAELRLMPDGLSYRILDRGSANGVSVNGQPIDDVALRPGDQIQIGQTVLIYHAESRGGELAERIRLIAQAGDDVRPAIVESVDAAAGSRLLTDVDESASPWLKTRLANLAILYEAGAAITHIHDLDQLLTRLLELTFESIAADRGCILLHGEEGGTLEPRAVRWRSASGERDLAISRTITDYVLSQRTGILVSDAASDARFALGQSIVSSGIREAICVPMRGRHETVGVLYLDTLSPRPSGGDAPQPTFTEDHLRLAIALAHQAALAVEGTLHYRALLHAERLAAVGQAIAALSHHIKNILQGLRSGGEILNLGMKDKDEALLYQGWRIVEKNQTRIYDLVLDMLSYSKAREPVHEPTDLPVIVADVAELVRGRAAELGVALQVKTDAVPVFTSDPEGVHRAILNLVQNALDAATECDNGQVEILASASTDGKWATVCVCDNGAGIETARIGDLFKPFVSSKGARGTGLGLAVSRKTARELGGDITVESALDAGSTFTLKLPLTAVGVGAPETPTQSAEFS